MSSSPSTPHPGWQFLDLKREVYLNVVPFFDVDAWLRSWVADYASSEFRRWSCNPRKVDKKKTLKQARKHLEAVIASGEPRVLHLENLVPLLIGLVEELVQQPRDGWEPDEKKKTIVAGLAYVSELTRRRQEAFHLESVLGLSRADSAAAMGVSKKAAGAHLSEAWTAMKDAGVDVAALKVFLTCETNGRCPLKDASNSSEGEEG